MDLAISCVYELFNDFMYAPFVYNCRVIYRRCRVIGAILFGACVVAHLRYREPGRVVHVMCGFSACGWVLVDVSGWLPYCCEFFNSTTMVTVCSVDQISHLYG